jgi:hypothetical protein
MLTGSIGMVCLAASAVLLAVTPPVSASCTTQPSANVTWYDSQGYVVTQAILVANPCGLGVEAGEEGPTGSPQAWGNDIKVPNSGNASVTGFIRENSGNHHGMRYWLNNRWIYVWVD